jgi:hypothetical protein
MRINADKGNYDRAQKADDHNFQMCSPVAGMHRVIHGGFCSSTLAVTASTQAKGRLARNNSGIVLRLDRRKPAVIVSVVQIDDKGSDEAS